MNLKLTKPICFFDLEATGTNVAKDRIVEISVLKVYPNGNKESYTYKVNPEIPIPEVTSKIHGIYDKDVENEPTFKDLSSKIMNILKGADLAGYNSNRYDIPLLAEELLRAGQDFDFSNINAVDVQTIFHKKEKRTLEAAYKFYCGKELIDAHSAEADTLATYEVLEGQLERYKDLEPTIKWLADFSKFSHFADFAGFIRYDDDGEEIFSFGKHKGKKVAKVLEAEPGYFSWLQNADFPLYTKKVITGIQLKKLATK